MRDLKNHKYLVYEEWMRYAFFAYWWFVHVVRDWDARFKESYLIHEMNDFFLLKDERYIYCLLDTLVVCACNQERSYSYAREANASFGFLETKPTISPFCYFESFKYLLLHHTIPFHSNLLYQFFFFFFNYC